MREAFHPVEIRQWNFPGLCLPPLENAFTHVYDNCEITLKTRGKMEKKASNVSSKLPRAAQLQTMRGKEAWQLKCCRRRT